MPTPTSPAAYGREREVWQQAIEAPRGIAVAFTTLGDAQQFRQRLYAARKLEQRLASAHGREAGTSYWDHLQVTIEQGNLGAEVIIRPLATSSLAIRELSE